MDKEIIVDKVQNILRTMSKLRKPGRFLGFFQAGVKTIRMQAKFYLKAYGNLVQARNLTIALSKVICPRCSTK